MAACAGAPDEIETEWHQVKKEITCFICRKMFTDPRILSCSHTFCRQCIEDRVEQARQNAETSDNEDDDEDHEYINTAFACPLCLAPLPEDGASSTWIDSSMSCLIDIFKRKEGRQQKLVEVTCGNCNDEFQQVTKWCLLCHCGLCSNCNAIHGRRKVFESHTTVNIAEFVQITRKPCKVHVQQMLDFYCKNCELPVCLECIVENHLEHNFDLVYAELENAEEILTSLREMAERARQRNKKAMKIPKKQTKNENPPVYVGMYDFLATDYNELSFSKGDLLYIISDDGDWWFAKAKGTGQEGYIPKNFITESKPLDDEDWFFGPIELKDAKRKLLHSRNTDGAFLVYECKDTPGEYCLAIRNMEKVANYRIRNRDGYYFIDQKVTFISVRELVAHYSKLGNNSPFIKTTLKKPCSKSDLQSNIHVPSGVLEIGKRQISFMKKLGEGHVGVVWQGVWNGITPVAVKILKPGLTGMAEFLGEISMIKQLKHPNLVELYALSMKEEPIYIVTELAKHGSLLEYLQGDGLSLQLPQQVKIMAQVATGMAYLEEKGFMHCNLAARNVMVCENLVCKVADFAFGQLLFHQAQAEDFCIKWTAPEALLHRRFSIKSDVWSFGIVLYEVITYGSFPYPGMNNTLVLKNLRSGARMWRPMRCPEKLYKIMRHCWKEVADERPTFETLQWQLDDYFINHY